MNHIEQKNKIECVKKSPHLSKNIIHILLNPEIDHVHCYIMANTDINLLSSISTDTPMKTININRI